MRDFRDAKDMAQSLRETMAAKSISVSHSESLEIVSRMLGVADWNTLSALLQAERREAGAPYTKHPAKLLDYPALPIRDVVPFPAAAFPLYVGRAKTRIALDHAFERNREIVLVTQRNAAVDEPQFGDVYEIGVVARLLEMEQLPRSREIRASREPGAGAKDEGSTLKILVQAHRRVRICAFVGDGGAFQAEIEEVSEGHIPNAPELIKTAIETFQNRVTARGMNLHPGWPALEQIRDPGRMADIFAQCMKLPIPEKQSVLAMLDPVARLKKIVALMTGDVELVL